jgi:hypothetical protein
LTQRLKALELQLSDNGFIIERRRKLSSGSWHRAQYLELIAPERAGLAEDEQRMAAREQALEAKMQQQGARKGSNSRMSMFEHI